MAWLLSPTIRHKLEVRLNMMQINHSDTRLLHSFFSQVIQRPSYRWSVFVRILVSKGCQIFSANIADWFDVAQRCSLKCSQQSCGINFPIPKLKPKNFVTSTFTASSSHLVTVFALLWWFMKWSEEGQVGEDTSGWRWWWWMGGGMSGNKHVVN